jgi:hypothetical protein
MRFEARSCALYLGLMSLAGAGCAAALWFIETRDLPANLLFADPARATGSPFYLSVFSMFGLLLWTAAAVLCGVGARLTGRGEGSRGMRRFLVGGALITLVVLLDDWLLVHEHVGPQLMHLPQKFFFGLYGLLAAVWLWTSRRTVLAETPAAYLAAAIALGALSIGIDTRAPKGDLMTVAEDGTKLLAILSWTFYFSRVTSRLIAERTA